MSIKKNFHKRNLHNNGYDFKALTKSFPKIKEFLQKNKYGNISIDFSNPKAVISLNQALLVHYYKVQNWNIPEGYLCPPIPGRADYIHYIADLLASSLGKIPEDNIKALDIGIGANAIYPIIGASVYNWDFVGSDIEKDSISSVKDIIASNENLKGKIEPRMQNKKESIFNGIIKDGEKFHFTMCNPPFHKSKKEAMEGNKRKTRNLTKQDIKKAKLNFGGKSNELWCKGGEIAFIKNMINESKDFKDSCLWFTTLVSKGENLSLISKTLKDIKVDEIKIVEMIQGQKITRFIAWTFIKKENRKEWFRS